MRNVSYLLAAAIVPILGLLSIRATDAAPMTQLGANIVVNGDAEAGQGAPSDRMPLMDIPGWARTGNFEVTQYGASGGFVDPNDPGPQDRGKNYFNGGPNNAKSSASQTIELTGLDTLVDASKITYAFSAYLGGFSNQNDHAIVTAEFQSTSGHTLGAAHLGPVMAADRSDKTELIARNTAGTIPKGTRKITVTITVVRTDGAYNDGSVDNISLVLHSKDKS